MEQQNFASYVPSSHPEMMDMLVSHLPYRFTTNGPTTPDSHEQPFDDSSYFNAAPQQVPGGPLSRVVECTLDPGLTDIPAMASPGSSRLSNSPSLGVAAPSPENFYPPYSEPLQVHALSAYQQELEEFGQQFVRSRMHNTSHPGWVNGAENWQYNYSGSDCWGAQPLATQPWNLESHEGHGSSQMVSVHVQFSNGASSPYAYPVENHFAPSEVVQTTATAAREGCVVGEVSSEDEDSESDDSDWNEEASSDSQAESSASRRRSQLQARSPRIERWSVPVQRIQQQEPRGYRCTVSGCCSTFLRPEHLRRHAKSKHCSEKAHPCKLPECMKRFSRGDNLRDHYWTHLSRGGRAGVNKKMTLEELKVILGPKEKKLIRRLREKQKAHLAKQSRKLSRPAYVVRSRL